jgi:hypothetical protein
MSFTAVLDTELGGAPLVQAVQEAFGRALVFLGSTEADETVTHRWRLAQEEGSLEVVEDASMNIVYAVATSTGIRAALVTAFGCFSAADIRDVLGGDIEAEHERLPMLALCNSQIFDTETERFLVQTSRHPRPEVRLSAVQVMATLGWPALRAHMFEMQSETDPRVVQVLRRAAAVWSARARAEKDGADAHVPVKKSFRKEMWVKRESEGKGKGKSAGKTRPAAKVKPPRKRVFKD